MAAATEPKADQQEIERFGRWARWFHAVTYIAVLVLLGTGWWLLTGREGDPSPLSRLTGVPDTTLHIRVGWAFTAIVVVAGALAARSVARFVVESVRFRSADLRWFMRWPRALLTGRFASHDGRYDPGQRILNIVLTLGLAVLVISGAGLALLHGGPVFAMLAKVHRLTTYPVTVLLVGHVLVASGVLPGYRGVWRSMHLGGHLRADVARRIWPAWTDDRTR
jgi:cytochrome b subunit of formate dehydrogenase